MEFRVIWEIEIDADNPKEAVAKARAVQLRPDMPATVFDVWEHARQRMHRIDLAPPSDRLDDVELASLRSALRRLQCASDLQPGMKDILSVMLIFLDAQEGNARRYRC
jgi:hypothetical protein